MDKSTNTLSSLKHRFHSELRSSPHCHNPLSDSGPAVIFFESLKTIFTSNLGFINSLKSWIFSFPQSTVTLLDCHGTILCKIEGCRVHVLGSVSGPPVNRSITPFPPQEL